MNPPIYTGRWVEHMGKQIKTVTLSGRRLIIEFDRPEGVRIRSFHEIEFSNPIRIERVGEYLDTIVLPE